MKRLRLVLPIISIIMLAGAREANSQEKDSTASDFDKRIESAVDQIFSRFDEQFGTSIFTEEPSLRADSCDSGETPDETTPPHRRWSQHRGFGVERSSLYSANPPNFIHRNSTILYPWYPVDDDVLFRYNRVEGFFLGLNSPKQYRWDGRHLNLFGSLGYGFAAHRWRFGGGIANQFGAGRRLFEFGVEGHSLMDTQDQWIVGDGENNLAALFARDDYRDYYGREGFSIWSGLYLRSNSSDAQFRLAYLGDRYSSLDRATNWSFFGGDKTFRDNPQINEGTMRSVLLSVDLHNARQRRYMTAGWSASASAEIAGRTFGGIFDFNRYIIDIRRYQQISEYDNLNLRLRAASATGNVPVQKSLELGGISTMPAFAYKEFFGNRLLLMNAEYLVNGDLFDEGGIPAWVARNFNLILFFDAGYTSTASTDASFLTGFNNLSSTTIKSDWGVGAGTRDGKMRLGFAWRTDVSEPVRVFFRIERPF